MKRRLNSPPVVRCKTSSAFTLVELLVVIAVVAILLALMLPALARGRARARTVVCMANQRGLSQALIQYTEDFRAFPVFISQWENWAYPLFGRSLSRRTWGDQNGVGYGIDKIRFCPETSTAAALPQRFDTVQAEGNAHLPMYPWGSAHVAWAAFMSNNGSFGSYPDWIVTGSYAINGYLDSAEGGLPATFGYYGRPTLIQNPREVPIFADSAWECILPGENNTVPSNLENPEAGRMDLGVGAQCLDRHLMAVNVAFLDQHVETVKLGNLWTLKWTTTWSRTTPATVPAVAK